MSELRWGILSTANIGRKAVAPAIVASRNGRVSAVASRDADAARSYAAELGAERAHGSYAALLEDDGVDALYIPLPNSLHKPWVLRALEAGKHVLCEKPLGLTEAECVAMAEAAERCDRHLMEAFMYRFHPRSEAALRLTPELEPRLLRSAFTFALRRPDDIRFDPDLGGGALMDVGCYCVNASRTLLGLEPRSVQAFARWGASGVDEEMVATLRFPGDVFAQFHCALTLPRQEFVEVVGKGGRLHSAAAFLPGSGAVDLRVERAGETERLPFVGVDEYRLMVEHFADVVLDDGTPRYGAREAALNMRVIDALYRSARADGAPQTLAG